MAVWNKEVVEQLSIENAERKEKVKVKDVWSHQTT